jgi:electron transport complex protein RnfD
MSQSTLDNPARPQPAQAPLPAAATTDIGPAPHLTGAPRGTRGVMIDVLVGLAPLTVMALWWFRLYALGQIVLCVASCLLAETLLAWMRRRRTPIGDGSAVITGLILALSLPATAPWFVGVVASVTAIGLGKAIYGGLGHNIFNPAMVGRAFVMVAFSTYLGAAAYEALPGDVPVSGATPLTAAKGAHQGTPLWVLMVGNHNGSLGEVSALACLAGGLYLCLRRTASWQIPLGMLLSVFVIGGLANLANPAANFTVLHHLLSGALLFGAFFIATDPVTSPLTPRGKFIFGLGVGLFIMVLRLLSGYPEGVMFAVLLMNALVPLINRWTIPKPVGGPSPVRK